MLIEAVERKDVLQLVAKVDPGNTASQRLIIRAGARRGEVLKECYERRIDGGKKRDLQCWYLDRPGVEPEVASKWFIGLPGTQHKVQDKKSE